MSDNICSKCGRDCRTVLALSKHVAKCSGSSVEFTNRFTDLNRCPKCSTYSKSFYVLNPETYVCLECGIHFTPKDSLDDLVDRCAGVKFDRGC